MRLVFGCHEDPSLLDRVGDAGRVGLDRAHCASLQSKGQQAPALSEPIVLPEHIVADHRAFPFAFNCACSANHFFIVANDLKVLRSSG